MVTQVRRTALPGWTAWPVAALGLALLAGVAVALSMAPAKPAARAPADPTALRAYTAALLGPTQLGGQIVAQEMRPSIADISSARIDGATLAARAGSWVAAMTRVRGQIDAIAVPTAVSGARALFDQALAGYVHTATLLEQAGLASGTARDALVAEAITAGTAADGLYDRASAIVQAALRAVGLPFDTNLPDPSPVGGA